MRNSNRRGTTSDDPGRAIVVFVLALLAILSFQGLRALLKPNTRDYLPTAYDNPHSQRLSADYFRALGVPRLLSGMVFLLIVLIGALLLPSMLAATLQGQQVISLLALTLLALLAVLMTLLMAQRTLPFAFASLILFALVAVFNAFVPHLRTLLAPALLSGGLVTSGIALLLCTTPDGREREVYPAWNELASWMLILVAFGVYWGIPFFLVLFGALLVLILLGAALSSEGGFDSDRLLVLLSALFAFVGMIAYWIRPDTLIGFVAFVSGEVLLVLATMLRRGHINPRSVISASLVTNPALVVPTEPTLIVLPAKSKYVPRTASELVGELLKLSDRLNLSVVAHAGEGITWQVASPGDATLLTQIAGDIRSHAPETETFLADAPFAPSAPTWRQLLLFGAVNDYAAPLPFAEHISDHDPLAILCQRMSTVQEGERIHYQVTITTATVEAKTRAFQRLQQGKIHPLASLWQDSKNPIEGLDKTLVTAKLESPLYHCFVSVTVESQQKERLEILTQAARDIEQFYLPGHNRLTLVNSTRPYEIGAPEHAGHSDMLRLLEAWKREHTTVWRDALCVLSAPEIAAVWHLPSDDYRSGTIAWAHGRVPDAVFDPTNGVPLGETTTPGMRARTVYVKATDRATHHYIAGKPKAGKSTLMLRLIQADIAAGQGVAVIDPHGKLVADVIRTSIPRERIDDVVLLECRRADYPVPLNPFRIPTGTTIARASNYLLFALQKIYQSIWLPGQTDLYIQNMVQLLLTDGEATPLDIQRLFQDDGYRTQLLERLSSSPSARRGVPVHSLQQFWGFYDNKKGGEQDRILSPIIHRTGVFTHSEHMELMTCHPYTLDFRQMIETKKIVLVDLSGDDILQDVDDLATLLVSGFFLGAYSLDFMPDNAPPRFYLYVDEIERTATAPLAQILSDSRKYGLAAILANQYMGQIPEDILNAILGTVGISTVFQVGIKDARFLAPQFEPELTDADLANLDLWRMAVKMRLEDKTLPAVVLKTHMPKSIEGGVQIEELRAKAEQELLHADAVHTWLDTRYGRSPEKPTTSSPRPKNSTWMGEKVTDLE